MGKKRIIIIAIIILLFIGLGTFVFANPDTDLEGNANNNTSNITNNTVNGNGEEPTVLDNPNDAEDVPNGPALIQNPVRPIVNTQNAYNAALAALQRAENSLAIEDAQIADALINALVASDNKSVLEVRLENVLNTIDLSALVQRAVSLLENSNSFTDIEALRTYMTSNDIATRVRNLIFTEVRNELISDINDINKIVSDTSSPVIAGYGLGYLKDTKDITIEDENAFTIYLNNEEISLNELKNITADGLYEIAVVDSAYNSASIVIRIDNEDPVIDIENNAQYKTGFIPSITDASLSSVTINGDAYAVGSAIEKPGYYHMVATDEVGNSSEVTFIVGKVPTRIEVVVPEGLVYDGLEKEITSYKIYNEYTGEEINADASVTYADNINAGTNDVTVTYAGDNYYAESLITTQMTIAKSDAKIILGKPSNLVYDGTKKEVSVKLIDINTNKEISASDVRVSYSKTPINARDSHYTATASFAGNENYNAAETVSLKFKINRAKTEIRFETVPEFVYDGTEKAVNAVLYDISNNKPITLLEPTISYSDSPVLAGNYMATASFVGNENYAPSENSLEFTIREAKTYIVISGLEDLTYNGLDQKVGIATLYDENDNYIKDLAVVYNHDEIINAGKYSASAYFAGETGKYTKAYLYLPFEIAQKEILVKTESVFRNYFASKFDNYVIKLANDITISTTLARNGVGTSTIDLNGYSLVSTSIKNSGALSNQNIILKNGSLELQQYIIYSFSSVVLENVNYISRDTAFAVRGNATLDINNSTINAVGYAISTNATDSSYHNVNINVNNSTIQANVGIMLNVPGILNVNNSSVTGSLLGMLVRGGTAYISNSTITSTKNEDNCHDYDNAWGTGSFVYVAALTIGNNSNGYQYPTYVELKNTKLYSSEYYPTLYAHANQGEGLGVTLIYDERTIGAKENERAMYGSENILINGTPYTQND